MAYTLWRGDEQLGYTVGEVRCNPSGTLSADMQMLSAYSLPAGFSQWSGLDGDPNTIELIIDSPEDYAKREPPVPCPAHADAGRGCFLAREYTGPVEHPTASAAFVLRDPDGRPLELAMLCVFDWRLALAKITPAFEFAAPHFRLSAIRSEVLELQRNAELVAGAT